MQTPRDIACRTCCCEWSAVRIAGRIVDHEFPEQVGQNLRRLCRHVVGARDHFELRRFRHRRDARRLLRRPHTIVLAADNQYGAGQSRQVPLDASVAGNVRLLITHKRDLSSSPYATPWLVGRNPNTFAG